jgi:hypothetical protein
MCGCVATATAQVMYFHQHPTNGVGPWTFHIKVNGVEQDADLRGGDGARSPYHWMDMVLYFGYYSINSFEIYCNCHYLI